MRFLAGLVLLAHAAVHGAIWLRPFNPEKREYDPRESWILRREEVDERGYRRAAVIGALVCMGILALGAYGFFRGEPWANDLAAGGAFLSLLLVALYFNPWLSLLGVVSLAIMVVAL